MDGKEVIKVKGFSKNALSGLHLQELEQLLYRNTEMEFNQEKWFKNIIESRITISDVVYHLKMTSNKRKPVYGFDSKGRELFIGTEPFHFNDIEKF